MKIYRVNQVFVPGGMPEHTFIERVEKSIKSRLESAQDNLCKLVTLTGQTKSGKTVLTKRVYPDTVEGVVWIEGGSISSESDLWNQIIEATLMWTTVEEQSEDSKGAEVSGDFEAEANALLIKGKGKLGGKLLGSRSSVKTFSRNLSSKASALKHLQENSIALVIDDFHYLERNLQGSVVRALKPLVFKGYPVILIAIPHRRFDAVKVEREITGRIENISVPYWSNAELKEIPKVGYPLLNIKVDDKVIDTFAREAQGSPHLMQEFCRELCHSNGISQTTENTIIIDNVSNDLFIRVAEGTGRVIYDKLATGPRQRSDRILRKMKDGSSVDIYKVILRALSHLKPGMDTIPYDQIRAAIREVLIDNIPQAHEVSRVLEKMSKIAYSDEASTPVLDWEKEEQILHVTDPFFAFYLKWGTQAV